MRDRAHDIVDDMQGDHQYMNQPTNNATLSTAGKWLITLFTLFMVVTAALAGNGIFRAGSMEWLITGHMHLGNLLFVMAVAQLVILFMLYTRKSVGMGVMVASALVFLFTFGQIGLGYSTRSHMVALVGWHIALGVALTAATAVLATLLWLPATKNQGGNTAG